jgi:MFS family permease
VVAFCFLAAVFTWGLGLFGSSVYLHEVTRARGWSVSLVSTGITGFYLTAALVLPAVGAAIDRHGSRPVIAGGAVLLALGVAAMGHVRASWQLHAAYVCMGLGYATMSVIGPSATIAPWFEKHQGRAVAMALTGASVGAMVVVPLVALSIARHGAGQGGAGGHRLAALEGRRAGFLLEAHGLVQYNGAWPKRAVKRLPPPRRSGRQDSTTTTESISR